MTDSLSSSEIAALTSFDGLSAPQIQLVWHQFRRAGDLERSKTVPLLCNLIAATRPDAPEAGAIAIGVLSQVHLATLEALLKRFPDALTNLADEMGHPICPTRYLDPSKASTEDLPGILDLLKPFIRTPRLGSRVLLLMAAQGRNSDIIRSLAQKLDLPGDEIMWILPVISISGGDRLLRARTLAELFDLAFDPDCPLLFENLFRAVTDDTPNVVLAALRRGASCPELWHHILTTFENPKRVSAWVMILARACQSSHKRLALHQMLSALEDDLAVFSLSQAELQEEFWNPLSQDD